MIMQRAGVKNGLFRQPLMLAMALLVMGLSGCGILEPVESVKLCDQLCDRRQLSADMDYWEQDGSTARFYGWLETLSDEQCEWIREDRADRIRSPQTPDDQLRQAIILARSRDRPEDLATADTLVEYYLDHGDPASDTYAFALLLRTSLRGRISGDRLRSQQQVKLGALEAQLEQENSARERLERQLERLKQIEESLLGSNTP
jgi:hypothetical protein